MCCGEFVLTNIDILKLNILEAIITKLILPSIIDPLKNHYYISL